MIDQTPRAVARRSFLARLSAAVAAVGAVGATRSASAVAPAQTSATPASGWQPARHAEDDWFEVPTAKHRMFFDTVSADALGQALFFARNVFAANASGYGLKDGDLALVICVRHESTSFAFDDAMWAKYGAALSTRAGGFVDPKSKAVPTTNVYLNGTYGDALKNGGVTATALTTRGLRFAVCGMATRAAAQLIAKQTGGNVDAVYTELTQHLIPGGHMVPAGIVAVNRAQERGYSFSYVA